MSGRPMVARAVIKRRSTRGATLLLAACAFTAGTLAGVVAMHAQAKPKKRAASLITVSPVRATFEVEDPFGGKGSIRVDRASFCRQVATEALLSMRPEFTAHSIRIERDTRRRGEVIEQFAETMGAAIERVWCAEIGPADQTE